MRLIEHEFAPDGRVRLAGFLHRPSPEMGALAVRPAVVVCPGGGYHFLSDREAEPIALAYAALGYHAFVLRYSIGDHAAFPEPLVDLARAMAHIRRHGAEWGVDPRRIAVCGFSAGGHLAASLGTLWPEPFLQEAAGAPAEAIRPDALVLSYPVIVFDIEAFSWMWTPVAAGRSPDEMAGLLSCDRRVGPHVPPVFLWHTRDDAVVPVAHALRFADALEAAGRPFELHVFRRGVHGLALSDARTSPDGTAMTEPRSAEWVDLSVSWLREEFALTDASDPSGA